MARNPRHIYESDFEEYEEYEEDFEDDESAPDQRRSATRRDQRKRKRSKERAGRMFDKQFGGSNSASSQEGAPRAAVYKGKMGSSHKRAARMQGGGFSLPAMPAVPGVGAVKEQAAHAVSHANVTSRGLKIFTAIACVVFACLFLYTPAQQYYHAQREHDRLVAEYASIESRNEALDVQNDILASDAGMEDSVRRKFGYVREGEELGVVTGLSEEATDTLRDSENIEANVLSSSVKAPEEWYTPLLDALFGVE